MAYRTISDFGKIKNNSANPWSYCAIQGPDSFFANETLGGTIGPGSVNCQAWMAEECSKEWSDMCEYVYQNQTSRNQPNTLNRTAGADRLNTNTAGQNLVANSVERAFCSYANCVPIEQPFNPTIPGSPNFTVYVGPDGQPDSCLPVCSVNPDTVDNDPLVEKMVQNPEICSSTMTNIFNTAMREGISYEGTKLHPYQQIHAQAVRDQQRATAMASRKQASRRNRNCFN